MHPGSGGQVRLHKSYLRTDKCCQAKGGMGKVFPMEDEMCGKVHRPKRAKGMNSVCLELRA